MLPWYLSSFAGLLGSEGSAFTLIFFLCFLKSPCSAKLLLFGLSGKSKGLGILSSSTPDKTLLNGGTSMLPWYLSSFAGLLGSEGSAFTLICGASGCSISSEVASGFGNETGGSGSFLWSI